MRGQQEAEMRHRASRVLHLFLSLEAIANRSSRLEAIALKLEAIALTLLRSLSFQSLRPHVSLLKLMWKR